MTGRQNHEGMQGDFDHNILKLKWSNMHARVRGNLTEMIWKDKQDVYTLTDMHRPPTQGNLCDEHGKCKHHIMVTDYNQHMGNISKGDRVANSY
jgi:hypothetical protein